jgi:hypothetical protein
VYGLKSGIGLEFAVPRKSACGNLLTNFLSYSSFRRLVLIRVHIPAESLLTWLHTHKKNENG